MIWLFLWIVRVGILFGCIQIFYYLPFCIERLEELYIAEEVIEFLNLKTLVSLVGYGMMGSLFFIFDPSYGCENREGTSWSSLTWFVPILGALLIGSIPILLISNRIDLETFRMTMYLSMYATVIGTPIAFMIHPGERPLLLYGKE